MTPRVKRKQRCRVRRTKTREGACRSKRHTTQLVWGPQHKGTQTERALERCHSTIHHTNHTPSLLPPPPLPPSPLSCASSSSLPVAVEEEQVEQVEGGEREVEEQVEGGRVVIVDVSWRCVLGSRTDSGCGRPRCRRQRCRDIWAPPTYTQDQDATGSHPCGNTNNAKTNRRLHSRFLGAPSSLGLSPRGPSPPFSPSQRAPWRAWPSSGEAWGTWRRAWQGSCTSTSETMNFGLF
jgi:hypothetical protein